MNPFLMWLRSHPAERLAIGIFLLVVLGIGWQALAHRGQTANPQVTPSPSGTSLGGAAPGASPIPSSGGTPAATDLAAASDVATKFLVAFNTYRYDDSPSTFGQRLQPLITDRLYHGEHLDLPSDPTYGRHPELHEVDTPTVAKLTSEGYGADGQLGFLARVSIQEKTDQWTATVTSAMEFFMVRQPDGWRVDSFTPGAQATETP
jgi:hypothetical protein